MKSKYFILIILLFIPLFFSGEELVDTYMKNARSYYVFKDFENAYISINFVLRSYKDKETPAKVYLLAEQIYHDYLKKMINKNNGNKINEISDNLLEYSPVSSDRIAIKLDEYNDKLEEEARKKEEDEKRQKELDKIEEEKIRELEAKRKVEEEDIRKKLELQNLEEEKLERELERQMKLKEMEHKLKLAELQTQMAEERRKEKADEENKDEFNQTLLAIMSAKEQTQASNFPMMMAFGFFGLIFLIIVVLLFFFIRNSQQQQQRMYEYSMRTLQQPMNILPMPMMNGQQSAMIEDRTGPSTAANQEMMRFKKLLDKCNSFSLDIDEATGRKNCTKNAAELTYKISKFLGYEETESMTYYAVGLVFDIGFLNIDHKILKAKEITVKQFEIIKTHPEMGLKLLHFVDDEYKQVFEDGVTKHHESLDGSGYPNGLKDVEIPYIARVLKVVDSFLALTSSREYKKVVDKYKAIKEIYKEIDKYDEKIVKALEEVV